MGLLDRIREAEQRAVKKAMDDERLAKQKQAEAKESINQQRREVAEAHVQSYIELHTEIIPRYIKNTEAVIKVLEAFPQANYTDYWKKVYNHTGFQAQLGIYSDYIRVDPKYSIAGKVTAVTNHMQNALKQSGLSSTGILNIYSPADQFLGHKGCERIPAFEPPRKKGELPSRLTEPQLPGIGIGFIGPSIDTSVERVDRDEEELSNLPAGARRLYIGGEGINHGELVTSKQKVVFLRFWGDNRQLTVNNGKGSKETSIDSFSSLDDVIEAAIFWPANIITVRFVPDPPEPPGWDA